VPNSLLGLKVLIAGRVDLFATAHKIAQYAALKEDMSNQIELAGTPFAKVKTYLAFSRENKGDKICENISKEIEKMKQDGSFQVIVNRYLKPNGK